MRRTHASIMGALGVEGKLVADQLGHSLDLNQNVYTQSAVATRQIAGTNWNLRVTAFNRSSPGLMRLQVVDPMERETGIEPATFSLGS